MLVEKEGNMIWFLGILWFVAQAFLMYAFRKMFKIQDDQVKVMNIHMDRLNLKLCNLKDRVKDLEGRRK